MCEYVTNVKQDQAFSINIVIIDQPTWKAIEINLSFISPETFLDTFGFLSHMHWWDLVESS